MDPKYSFSGFPLKDLWLDGLDVTQNLHQIYLMNFVSQKPAKQLLSFSLKEINVI